MGQMAALEALRHGANEVEKMVKQYDQRRRLIIRRLRDMGLECFEPKGAFYVFPSIRTTGMNAEEFSQLLLQEEKVAVVHGTAFGESGEGYIRCSYATSVDKIAEAMDRMDRFVKRHQVS
jgi:aminotransferase